LIQLRDDALGRLILRVRVEDLTQLGTQPGAALSIRFDVNIVPAAFTPPPANAEPEKVNTRSVGVKDPCLGFVERKPFGEKRPESERKPFGEKRYDSERKPYGDKRPEFDRKPFGDKRPDSGGKPSNWDRTGSQSTRSARRSS